MGYSTQVNLRRILPNLSIQIKITRGICLMSITCCRNCTKRCLYCHSTCQDYLEQRRILDEENKARHEALAFDYYRATQRSLEIAKMHRKGKDAWLKK